MEFINRRLLLVKTVQQQFPFEVSSVAEIIISSQWFR